jgi:hypothetical protein
LQAAHHPELRVGSGCARTGGFLPGEQQVGAGNFSHFEPPADIRFES